MEISWDTEAGGISDGLIVHKTYVGATRAFSTCALPIFTQIHTAIAIRTMRHDETDFTCKQIDFSTQNRNVGVHYCYVHK